MAGEANAKTGSDVPPVYVADMVLVIFHMLAMVIGARQVLISVSSIPTDLTRRAKVGIITTTLLPNTSSILAFSPLLSTYSA